MDKFELQTLNNQLCQKAIEVKGWENQLNQAQEEAGELIVAINKFRRAETIEEKEVARNKVLEEMIDVWIMQDQLSEIFDLRGNEYMAIRKRQLEKLDAYLKEEENGSGN